MAAEPAVVARSEQPTVGISGAVTMRTIPAIADRFPEVFGWLAARGIEPAGAPFLRYHVIDASGELVIEAGVPVAEPVDGDGDVRPGVLPGGRYATIVHIGRPDELMGVTALMLDWAAAQGLSWDATGTDAGERWGCRLEIFHSDPAVVPEPADWETELAFRLAD